MREWLGKWPASPACPLACQITVSEIILLRPFFLLTLYESGTTNTNVHKGQEVNEPSVTCIFLILIKSWFQRNVFYCEKPCKHKTAVDVAWVMDGKAIGSGGMFAGSKGGHPSLSFTWFLVFGNVSPVLTRLGISEELEEIWTNMWAPLLNFASIYSLMSEFKY